MSMSHLIRLGILLGAPLSIQPIKAATSIYARHLCNLPATFWCPPTLYKVSGSRRISANEADPNVYCTAASIAATASPIFPAS